MTYLGPRFREMAAFVCQGLRNKEIAERMKLSLPTVHQYLYRAYVRTGVSNRAEFAAWWLRNMVVPKVSLIVSTCNRPDQLTCNLYALKVQTMPDFEVIVADNSPSDAAAARNRYIVARLGDERFRHRIVRAGNCYEAAEIVAKETVGEYLGFPSEDNYYVPGYLERMLRHSVDLIYCDMIYDPRMKGEWSHIDVQPVVGRIDKGGFLLRRSLFDKFPADPRLADGLLVNELMARGVSHAKAPGVLWVHN